MKFGSEIQEKYEIPLGFTRELGFNVKKFLDLEKASWSLWVRGKKLCDQRKSTVEKK
jgi:hypothetical protein